MNKVYLPDLLIHENGQPVTEASWQQRRQELLRVLRDSIYGHAPKAPETVQGTVMDQNEVCCAGKAILETIEISWDTPAGRFSFPLKYFRPTAEGKHPLILLINFRPDVYDRYYPAEEIIDRGFALGMICYEDVTRDNDDMADGLAGMYTAESIGVEPSKTWGKIGMWAFAMSRALDHLLTLPEVDASHVGVCGHSRLGKTALWCGAQDERVTYVYSNDSGCAGAAYERAKHEQAETYEIITRVFPFWFNQQFSEGPKDPKQLPFDQHFLLAAICPRKVCVGSAAKDLWADPIAEQLTCQIVSPAWKLLGQVGYVGPETPVNIGEQFLNGDIGYHLRDGIHFFSRTDWLAWMTFLEYHIGKAKHRKHPVFFVRHGQSEWNVADKICGSTDIPLTEQGHDQAVQTGQAFLDQGVTADLILYSPLSRAAETARHISEMTGIPRRMEPRLMEQNFGKWEGTSPRSSEAFKQAKTSFVTDFEGGESMLRLAQRIYNLLDELKAQPDRTYILVAHNGIARVVQSYFADMTNEEYAGFGVKNCEIHRFEFDE